MTDHRAAYGLLTGFDPFARIEADSNALADAAAGRLAEPVPSCPGWSVADLVWHLTGVQAAWGQVVRERLQHPSGIAEPARPGDAELVTGLREGAARMVATFRAADPHEKVWTWSQQHDAAFVVRHQVHEAAVHRWDAANAVGVAAGLDAAVAADSVDEFLQHTTPFRAGDAAPVGGRVVLVATDVHAAWSVDEDADGTVTWRRSAGEPEQPATVVRGTAGDLLLYLYRRRPAALDVTGEVGVAQRFALRNPTD